LIVGKQLGFSDYELTTGKKPAKREKLLPEKEVMMLSQALIDFIKLIVPRPARRTESHLTYWRRGC